MQIYTDANGIQQWTAGSVSIDSDTGLYIFPVHWFGDFDPAKVGGYSVIEGKLFYSQEAFEANEALKAELIVTESTGKKSAVLVSLKELLTSTTPDGIVERAKQELARSTANTARAYLAALKQILQHPTLPVEVRTLAANLPATPPINASDMLTLLENAGNALIAAENQ